jgi:hypothetical protein
MIQALQVNEEPVSLPRVDKMLNAFRTTWIKTMDDLLHRAMELEEMSADLRNRAEQINRALSLTDDVRATVLYEIESRKLHEKLALVNPIEMKPKH